MKYYSIAIDGPAGAGKSTIAKKIAQTLGFIYVDTGALYRAMALYFLRNQIEATDIHRIEEACSGVNVTIEYKNGEQLVILNGENVNGLIRTEDVGNMASGTSIYKAVRSKLVELQQNLAQKENVVMDGRDIGTFVLPDADLKIYMTATSQERARRRWEELNQKKIQSDINEIEADIIERDRRDMNREISPLKQAEDAILLDTSHMSIDEVVNVILNLFQKTKN